MALGTSRRVLAKNPSHASNLEYYYSVICYVKFNLSYLWCDACKLVRMCARCDESCGKPEVRACSGCSSSPT